MKRIGLVRLISSNKNYYEVLGLSINADQNQIKQSYLNLAKKFHPDSAEGNEEFFKMIGEAYGVLKNEEKKAEYDKKLEKAENKNKKSHSDNFHSSEKQHKRYKNTFQTGSWSGGKFEEKKEEKNTETIKPSDVLLKMATYSFASAGAVLFIYICYLIITPVEKKEKIIKPAGVITKLPERLPAKKSSD